MSRDAKKLLVACPLVPSCRSDPLELLVATAADPLVALDRKTSSDLGTVFASLSKNEARKLCIATVAKSKANFSNCFTTP